MTMDTFFRSDAHPGHVVLWNTNTATRNALSYSYYDGLVRELERAGRTPETAAVILAGEGSFFCSGGDLNQLKERRAMPLEHRRASINRLHDAIRAIRACPKPVICAVEGGAAGAGFSLALSCDMVVSAAGAKFVLAYVKAGLVPDGGVTHALMQSLPRATVSRMAMLADPISAERLYDLGILTEIVEPGQSLLAAQTLADRIAIGPEQAISAIKNLLNGAQSATLDDQLEAECTAMAEAFGRDEAHRGITAFLNKNVPVFR